MLTVNTPLGLDELAKHDLVLPDELIPEMRRPFGELVEGERPDLELSGSGKIVAVGDQCTLNILRQGIKPDLAIVDYKTKREKIESAQEMKGFELILKLSNPAGRIVKESWDVLRSAFDVDKKVRIDVEGEEDLLALPSIMLAPLGSKVLYGMPSRGVVVVNVDDRIKNKVLNLLTRMVVEVGN